MKKQYLLLMALLLCFSILWAEEQITILFYADTREDPFANWSQNDHEKFVKKIVANEKDNNIQQMIFGGDNVWLGFMDSSWKRFFEITNNFRNQNIKIYPAIGNHEIILSRTLYAQLSREFAGDRDGAALASYETFMATLENDWHKAVPSDLCQKINVVYRSSEKESKEIMQTMENPGTMSTNWDRFKKYVDAWPYLQEVVTQGKTYYSFLLPIGQSQLFAKIVVLDSNFSDAAQSSWLAEELKYTGGPVILISHHPIFYPEKDWNSPPHLWLTGHHHDYERRSLDAEGKTGPVHMISGSGGAPTESGDPHCNDSKTRVHKNWYNYSRITITSRTIHVRAFGCAKVDNALSQFDDFEFAWKK